MNSLTNSSLVIATYNWPAALGLCLKSVACQTCMPDEIIIADDGSDKSTREVVESYQKILSVPIVHVWHEDQGFRKTIILNKAIGLANSEYIIQIDGDVILNKHFISDHLALKELKTFIRGTRAMLTEDLTKKILQSGTVELSPFGTGIENRNNAFRSYTLKWFGNRKERSCRSVRGSNLSFWKADFISVNGYNNELTGWGHEDEELAARFINSGVIKKIVKLAAVQYHLHHPISERTNEPKHADEVNRVIEQGIKFCNNGYRTIS